MKSRVQISGTLWTIVDVMWFSVLDTTWSYSPILQSTSDSFVKSLWPVLHFVRSVERNSVWWIQQDISEWSVILSGKHYSMTKQPRQNIWRIIFIMSWYVQCTLYTVKTSIELTNAFILCYINETRNRN